MKHPVYTQREWHTSDLLKCYVLCSVPHVYVSNILVLF